MTPPQCRVKPEVPEAGGNRPCHVQQGPGTLQVDQLKPNQTEYLVPILTVDWLSVGREVP